MSTIHIIQRELQEDDTNKLVLVAVMNFDDEAMRNDAALTGFPTTCMEEAFEFTNNRSPSGSWSLKIGSEASPLVDVLQPVQRQDAQQSLNGLRSTQAGDLMIINGGEKVCAIKAWGFVECDEASLLFFAIPPSELARVKQDIAGGYQVPEVNRMVEYVASMAAVYLYCENVAIREPGFNADSTRAEHLSTLQSVFSVFPQFDEMETLSEDSVALLFNAVLDDNEHQVNQAAYERAQVLLQRAAQQAEVLSGIGAASAIFKQCIASYTQDMMNVLECACTPVIKEALSSKSSMRIG